MLRGARRPEFLRDELLAEIFAATVAAVPQAIAMTTMERKITYAAVDHEATALARGLMRRGIGPATSWACGGRAGRNC